MTRTRCNATASAVLKGHNPLTPMTLACLAKNTATFAFNAFASYVVELSAPCNTFLRTSVGISCQTTKDRGPEAGYHPALRFFENAGIQHRNRYRQLHAPSLSQRSISDSPRS